MRSRAFGVATWFGLGIALATSAGAFASEPPHTQADAALRGGRVAFVGKVLALTLDEHPMSSHIVSALAKLQVKRCFYGRECEPKVLEFSYVVEREDEGGLGIDLLLGEEYLIVLHHGGGEHLKLESTWKAGIDLVYRLKSPYAAAPGVVLSNAWLPRLVQRIPVELLERLAAERRAQLQQAEERSK